MSLTVWLILGVVILVVLGVLWLRLKRKKKFRSLEEEAKHTVGELLSKTKAEVEKEIKDMKPEERMERWKDLYQ